MGCHICIVGTKLDLVQSGVATRAVRPEEVEALATKHRAHLFETSAKQVRPVDVLLSCTSCSPARTSSGRIGPPLLILVASLVSRPPRGRRPLSFSPLSARFLGHALRPWKAY